MTDLWGFKRFVTTIIIIIIIIIRGKAVSFHNTMVTE